MISKPQSSSRVQRTSCEAATREAPRACLQRPASSSRREHGASAQPSSPQAREPPSPSGSRTSTQAAHAATPASAQYLFSPLIQACQSWQELLELYRNNRTSMLPGQLVLVLSCLAKTSSGSRSNMLPVSALSHLSALQQQVLGLAGQQALQPRELATAIWASAKLQHVPSKSWATSMLAASQPQLTRFNAQDMSMSVWAAATLCCKLPVGWVDAFLAASRPRLAAFGAQALSNTLWALVALRCRPPADWLDAILHASAPKLADFGPQALANTAAALTSLEHAVPPAWRSACLARTLQLASFAPPQSVAQLAWSIARMDWQPGRAWLETFQAGLKPRMDSFGPQDVSMLLWAVAHFSTMEGSQSNRHQQQQPTQGTDAAPSAPPAAGTGGSSAEPQSTTAASMESPTHSGTGGQSQQHAFLSVLCGALRRQAPRMKPQELTSSLSALARMVRHSAAATAHTAPSQREPLQPPAHQQQQQQQGQGAQSGAPHNRNQLLLGAVPAVADALRARLHSCSAQSLANSLWALASLRCPPSAPWMAEWSACFTTKLGDCGPQELANVWWALGVLRWKPNQALHEELLAESLHALRDAEPGEIAMLLGGMVALGMRPSKRMLDGCVARLRSMTADSGLKRAQSPSSNPTSRGVSALDLKAETDDGASSAGATGESGPVTSLGSATDSDPLQQPASSRPPMMASTLVTLSCTLAKLHATSQRSALRSLAASWAARGALGTLQMRELAIVCNALARVGVVLKTCQRKRTEAHASRPVKESSAAHGGHMSGRAGEPPRRGLTGALLAVAAVKLQAVVALGSSDSSWSRISSSSYGARDVAMLLHALMRMGAWPRAAWLQKAWAAAAAVSPSMSHAERCMALHALASMQYKLPRQHMSAVQSELRAQLLASCIAGTVLLQTQLQRQWQEEQERQQNAALRSPNTRAHARSHAAAAQTQRLVRPMPLPHAVPLASKQESDPHGQHAVPSQVAIQPQPPSMLHRQQLLGLMQTMQACRSLHADLDAPQLHALVQSHVTAHLPTADGQGSGIAGSLLGRFKSTSAALAALVAAHLPQMKDRQLVSAVHCLAALRPPVTKSWVARFMQRAHGCSHVLDRRQLRMLHWALLRLAAGACLGRSMGQFGPLKDKSGCKHTSRNAGGMSPCQQKLHRLYHMTKPLVQQAHAADSSFMQQVEQYLSAASVRHLARLKEERWEAERPAFAAKRLKIWRAARQSEQEAAWEAALHERKRLVRRRRTERRRVRKAGGKPVSW